MTVKIFFPYKSIRILNITWNERPTLCTTEWLSPTDYGLRNQAQAGQLREKSLAVDMGCNLWPLHQWGDATSPISFGGANKLC